MSGVEGSLNIEPLAEGDSGKAARLAAVERIQLWLDLHPDTVSVAGEIGSDEGFRSEGWPYRLYAIDRRDMEAVLNMARKALKGSHE